MTMQHVQLGAPILVKFWWSGRRQLRGLVEIRYHQ